MHDPRTVDRRHVLFVLTASLYAPLAATEQGPTPSRPLPDVLLRGQLATWSDADRAILRQALTPDNGGRIDAQTVNRLIPAAGSADALMTMLLPIASTYSRAPISKFEVGAVARGGSGALYLGANLEVPRSGLNQTIHGEQSAVANAFGHEETGIAALAVSGAPCGHCRQFLNELADGESLRLLAPGNQTWTLKDLLPSSFGPKDLQQTEAIFASKPHALRLPAGNRGPVMASALEAAVRSYAPYSHSPSGCAIETKAGTIVKGSYLENAAFNPSLAPLQSALVSLVMHQEIFADMTRVVLVESSGGTISHAAETRMVLATLAPHAKLDVVTAAMM